MTSRATFREVLSYGCPSMTGYFVLVVNESIALFWLRRLAET